MSSVKSVFVPNIFASKVAIVTGGATGIGQAITRELLHLGCKVVIASRKEDKLKQTVERIAVDCKHDAKIDYVVCNIRSEADVSNLMKTTLTKFGRIDFLVNNGGGQFPARTGDIKLKGWNAVIETNLTGTFLCIREAYNHWMKENGGIIVNITMDSLKGWPLFTHSSATRAAVDNMAKSLAVEWASNKIRINNVAPGIIYSDTAVANYGEQGKAMFKKMITRVPAMRLGHVEEIANAVLFFCSPAATYITGQTLYVDGGISLYKTQMFEVPEFEALDGWYWDESSKPKL